MTFAQKVIQFNNQLDFKGTLPPGINIMNPYKENGQASRIMNEFYTKYYNDDNKRHLILGINPGRFGSGVTGVAFTDSKRLKSVCKFGLLQARKLLIHKLPVAACYHHFFLAGCFYMADNLCTNVK